MGGYIILVVTLITTALGVYIGASFTLAQKQILAATRLLAYLLHWKQWAINTESYELFRVGETWDQEEQELIRRCASPELFRALKEEKKAFCTRIMEKADGPNGIEDELASRVAQAVRGYTKENIAPSLDAIRMGRQNLITGQQFITDEEASYLGVQMAYSAISLKNGIVELSDSIVFMLVSAVNSDSKEPKPLISGFYKLLWKATLVSKDYHGLLRNCQTFTNSGVLALTWRNIVQGSRVTRR